MAATLRSSESDRTQAHGLRPSDRTQAHGLRPSDRTQAHGLRPSDRTQAHGLRPSDRTQAHGLRPSDNTQHEKSLEVLGFKCFARSMSYNINQELFHTRSWTTNI
ncbi:hypothetical protein M8J77_016603 [Diaphorina citri]|nr:hypothetical protein M8J77_016603 [Diaphorina citri]